MMFVIVILSTLCCVLYTSSRPIYVLFALNMQAYANNQHKIADEMLTNPFLKAMSICKGTISILDAGCVVYSRIWCIFELFKSVMGGNNSKYEFDVYTDRGGDNRAVGITHGYIPSDNGESDYKKHREYEFPLDRILQATNVDVKHAQASVESDRRFILNTITGLPEDDEVVDDHANYDELNNILRGIFVTPALQRIIKEKDFDTITRCLDIVRASNTSIIDLDLQYYPRFDDDILMKLADSLPPTLTEFTLISKGSAVTVNGINASVGQITGCPQLKKLILRWNNIGDDGAKMIADALNGHHSLKTLVLRCNNIGDDGAKHIADALKDNHSLTILDLKENNICADGAKMIADVLKYNHSLKELSLSDNNIGANGAKMIADALKINQNLTLLDLHENNIGDDGIKQIADALKDNHILETLNIGSNKIGDDGAKAIADTLKINHSLKILSLNGNNIGADGAKMIADALKDNHSLEELDLGSNKIGVDGKGYLSKIKQELKAVKRYIYIHC